MYIYIYIYIYISKIRHLCLNELYFVFFSKPPKTRNKITKSVESINLKAN